MVHVNMHPVMSRFEPPEGRAFCNFGVLFAVVEGKNWGAEWTVSTKQNRH
jgi:hypothetical protein